MAILTDSQLYQFFETGDIPTQQQFRDLIDSKLNVNNIPGLGLEVGVTQVASGIDKGIYFQNGTTFSQDSNFLFDYTNDRLGVGGSPISRFHIQSSTGNSDSSSLGITFKRTDSPNTNTTASAIRSANSLDALLTNFGTFYESGGGQRFSVLLSADNTTAGTEKMRLSKLGRVSLGANMLDGAMVDIQAAGTLSTDLSLRIRNSANTANQLTVYGTGSIGVLNGTNIGALTDSFQMYSTDITAGNAAPHFRTENGNIIKIYQETTGVAAATIVSGTGGNAKHDDTYDGYTIQQVVKALRNQGLLA